MERKILNVRKLDKICNKKIRKITKAIDVIDHSKQLKWRFAGHVQRLQDNRWTLKVEKWVPQSPRKKRKT